MADSLTPLQRSMAMAAIKSKGNASTEKRLARMFRAAGISGWRRNQPILGRPDFVFRECRVVVFVDGCFWHGCPRCYLRPKSNTAYWDQKIARNRRRDRKVTRGLNARGWTVLRIWEHSLVSVSVVQKRVNRVLIASQSKPI